MNESLPEKLDSLNIQFDYVAKVFRVAIIALEEISSHQEKSGQIGIEFQMAQKALRTIKALTNEACTED